MTALLQAHIWTAAASLLSFALASGVALLYLVQLRHLKRKRFGTMFRRLPSLAALDRLNLGALRAGLATYVVSLAAGALTASAAWSRAWSWEPLQLVSVGVLGMYALLALVLPRWTVRRRAVGSVAAFALVAGTLVSVVGVADSDLHPGRTAAPAAAEAPSPAEARLEAPSPAPLLCTHSEEEDRP